ncbi:hypothetical protein BSKO_00075 [Bryopsis sp. KO-2023]|nr:hypothetical protein BSKO_00075 [Bryopsis sp. KO-2023]
MQLANGSWPIPRWPDVCSTSRHKRCRFFRLEAHGEAPRPLDEPEGRLRAVTSSLVGLLSFAAAQPAHAVSQAWHPRRHHKRLGEQWHRKPYTEQAEKQLALQEGKVQKLAKKRNMQTVDSKPKAKEIVLSANAPSRSPNLSVPTYFPSSRARSAQSMGGMGAFLVAAAIICVLFFWKKLAKIFRGLGIGGGRRSTKGRWVSDRSLGGKQIFVPYEGRESEGLNPLAVSSAPAEPEKVEKEKIVEIPEWWNPPGSIFIPASVKEKAAIEARKLMRQLENTKVGGQDYSLEAIVQLYKTCEYGGVTAGASSANITMSIFRRGVECAVDQALRKGALVDRMPPTVFVSGLATYLSIGVEKATDITHGTVASKCRSLLLEVAADIRSHGATSSLNSSAALSIVNLVSAFPLSENSAQVELLPATMRSVTTAEERVKMYHFFGLFSPKEARLVGKMLGEVS